MWIQETADRNKLHDRMDSKTLGRFYVKVALGNKLHDRMDLKVALWIIAGAEARQVLRPYGFEV
jgi:hypothetical protein